MTDLATFAHAIAALSNPEMAEKWAEPICNAASHHRIDTPSRLAAFLAQIAHESGGFRWVKEIWGPSLAQARYEGRKDLGNTEPGDGSKYRGRGLIQITGRNNYQKAGRALNLPLEAKPEMLEMPEHAAESAAWFWDAHRCNELADVGEYEKITRVINGGLNGWADRLDKWKIAKHEMGI